MAVPDYAQLVTAFGPVGAFLLWMVFQNRSARSDPQQPILLPDPKADAILKLVTEVQRLITMVDELLENERFERRIEEALTKRMRGDGK